MIYMADTANIEELKKLYYYFPLAGVATNPSILDVEKKTFIDNHSRDR